MWHWTGRDHWTTQTPPEDREAPAERHSIFLGNFENRPTTALFEVEEQLQL